MQNFAFSCFLHRVFLGVKKIKDTLLFPCSNINVYKRTTAVLLLLLKQNADEEKMFASDESVNKESAETAGRQ